MRYISHRGNIIGRVPEEENTVKYIYKALDLGYDVEIDVWMIEGTLFLGHDSPQIKVPNLDVSLNMWCHAKNIEVLLYLKDIGANCFFHDKDACTLTSYNKIWTFPGEKLTSDSIAVLPELARYSASDLSKCYGICSDYIEQYKE